MSLPSEDSASAADTPADDAGVDRTFRYDNAILASCAASGLVASVVPSPTTRRVVVDSSAHASAGDDALEEGRPARPQSWRRKRAAAVADDDDYDDDDGDGGGAETDPRDRACRELFERHAEHYRRRSLSREEGRRAWGRTERERATAGADRSTPSRMPGRVETFLRSVAFVHEHNYGDSFEGGEEVENDGLEAERRTAARKRTTKRHRVGLNRFSDIERGELPLMRSAASRMLWGERYDDNHGSTPDDDDDDGGLRPPFVRLEDEEIIRVMGDRIATRRRQRRPFIREDGSGGKIGGNPTNAFENRWEALRPLQWLFGRGDRRRGDNMRQNRNDDCGGGEHCHNHHNQQQTRREVVDGDDNRRKGKRWSRNRRRQEARDDSGFVVEKEGNLDHLTGGSGGSEMTGEEDEEEWAVHLNWATEDNPDGVPIVNDVIDQGNCGSCWAIAATGTLEASVARNVAYLAYEDAYNQYIKMDEGKSHDDRPPSSHRPSASTAAAAASRGIESLSIDVADLSVQELIDCDAKYDLGCEGGNPILAFYFIHRYGIASARNYSYTGSRGSCRLDEVARPIATVESWGILTPDNEANLEKVVRFIGPVAVGLNGADPAFLAYVGGVFNSSECGSGADHAMLIVGYGVEMEKNGAKTRYWIARNSWGTGWGEDGYVRVARTPDGAKGHGGICGIARSPSVALGGMFTRDVRLKYEGGRGGDLDVRSTTRTSSTLWNLAHRLRLRLANKRKGMMMSYETCVHTNVCEYGEVQRWTPYFFIATTLVAFVYIVHRRRSRPAAADGRRQRRRSTAALSGCETDPGRRANAPRRKDNEIVIGETTSLLQTTKK